MKAINQFTTMVFNSKNNSNLVLLTIAIGGIIGLGACKKDEPKLEGTASVSSFTYAVKRSPGGDTLPFSNAVVFTNTSTDAFAYLWDFGDANSSTLANPVHAYSGGNSFKVKMTSVGKRGNNTSTQTISFGSPCDYEPFKTLTGCSNRKWSVSPVSNAIVITQPSGDSLVLKAANCLTDDQYTFNISGSFNYDAKGNTLVFGDSVCSGTRPNANKYFMLKGNDGANPKLILLQGDLAGNPFIGTTQAVKDNSYEILAINEDEMKLQATLNDGSKIKIRFVNASLSIRNIRLFLSGGSKKTWRLDPAPGANAITAGTESNPTQYYAGGPLAPCQGDDEYIFTSSDSLLVDFKGEALVYGGPGDYNCKPYGPGLVTPYPFASPSAYTLGPIQGSGVGAAQLVLANSNQFIGVMDRVANLYRIVEISSTRLVIRVGDGSGNIQVLKLIAK